MQERPLTSSERLQQIANEQGREIAANFRKAQLERKTKTLSLSQRTLDKIGGYR